ncbi:acyclic terpene utilization AtuA family protein [Ignavibacterium sp.]|uniref:acyclic terpene utilization AtuA family protein n=1 Tax=Ignavibacterium sp. TaxID=2651167 RepID=UPI002205DCF5|nr:acyclic terpene utilization AtuA family protein [Ignavibacterium sp.]BDQ01811.1 MAG: ABC transporter substrate-binding protein [Ignavibacterium sp.]
MKEKIRIASGQGFWGDLIDAPYHQVTKGPIDYLVMDYLAEVTMSILQKQKNKNPELGYARDIPELMKRILPICKEKNIKVITNGGGVNPLSCANAVMKVAGELGIKNLKIGIVLGDNILDRLDEIISSGAELKNMETGEPITSVKDKLLSANVYFGAFPIVEALQKGADIVITGRTTDTGLTLAPMIYEFGWSKTDYDKLSAGTVAGHILECGAQSSGGNFLGDWKSIPNMAEIGFPIAEAFPNGEVIITKHKNTGGRVSFETVAEQLLYEIGDPKSYITPDCVADFTSIKLEDLGNDRVRVFDVKGFPETEFYKVSCSYSDGYSASATLTYSWPEALTKAKAADQILRKRLENLNLTFDEIRTEFIGYNACHGPLAKQLPEDDINEIMLKVAVRSHNFDSVERFGKEIAPLILTGPPSVTGFAGGRPKPSEVVAYWPALIPKSLVKPEIKIIEL